MSDQMPAGAYLGMSEDDRNVHLELVAKQSRLEQLEKAPEGVGLLIGFAVAAVCFMAAYFLEKYSNYNLLKNNGYLIATVATLSTWFGLIWKDFIRRGHMMWLRTQVKVLQEKERISRSFQPVIPAQHTGAHAGEQTSNYFDQLVKINVENLADYYGLVKTHADNSFWTSIGVGLVGFGLIVLGLILGLFEKTRATNIAALSAMSGVLTEFIGAVFFYLYNQTVRQMKEYHESLLAVQNALLSFKIVGETKDDSQKVEIISRMIAYLLAKTPAPQAHPDRATKGSGFNRKSPKPKPLAQNETQLSS